MKNTKRAIAVALVLMLALAQVAFAADVSTVNGIWLGKMSASVGGVSFTAVRIKLQDGRVQIQAFDGKEKVKTASGTYTVADNNIVFTVPSATFLPERGVMTYALRGATKTKPARLVLNGMVMSLSATQAFDAETVKVSAHGYTKVKRNTETNLKIRTSSGADFVIVYDKSGTILGVSETKSATNVFVVPIAFSKKSNTVYAKAGVYDVDGKVQTKYLSAKRTITVNCK